MRGNAPCGVKGVMGYALSARGIFALAQKCRMYQSRSTFPQGVALGYGQHLGLQPAPTRLLVYSFTKNRSFSTDVFLTFSLRFSAALGNMSKLYCTRLHENSAALGIARTSSALRSPCTNVVISDKTERNIKFKNDKTERKNLSVFDKTERNEGYSIRIFLPQKTLHPFIISAI